LAIRLFMFSIGVGIGIRIEPCCVLRRVFMIGRPGRHTRWLRDTHPVSRVRIPFNLSLRTCRPSRWSPSSLMQALNGARFRSGHFWILSPCRSRADSGPRTVAADGQRAMAA